MLIEQIIEFELRGPGPLAVHVLLQLVIFRTKKSLKENLRVDSYLLLKYWTKQSTLLSPTWAESLTNFNPKLQNFKRVLDLL